MENLLLKNSLWTKVLFSKYGEVYGRLNRDGRLYWAWWRDLQNIEKGIWGFKSNWLCGKM